MLLFCRTLRSPGRAFSPSRGPGVSPSKLRAFVYCGRLRAPRVDWAAAGGYGEVTWTLQVKYRMGAVLMQSEPVRKSSSSMWHKAFLWPARNTLRFARYGVKSFDARVGHC